MTKKYDCIIVGAGPAGSAAALTMAREGMDVLLLERGSQPGEKNVMGGVIFPKELYLMIPDYRERAPLERCVIEEYWYFLEAENVFRLPSYRNYSTPQDPYPPYTVFRSRFDPWFSSEAVRAGAELVTATLVEDLLWKDGNVTGVRTDRGEHHGRVVIGADGAVSTVGEKSGLRPTLSTEDVTLVLREVIDLEAEVIEQRFALRTGEGFISEIIGQLPEKLGKGEMFGAYLYSYNQALAFGVSVDFNLIKRYQIRPTDLLEEVKRHPYITELIRGGKLREFQAHMIPYTSIKDLSSLYGNGVLMAGDAGNFLTFSRVGFSTCIASGAAAAQAVIHAHKKGDFSKQGLSSYQDWMEKIYLADIQRENAAIIPYLYKHPEIYASYPRHATHLARRFSEEMEKVSKREYPHSLWGEAYYTMIKPLTPWYLRWLLSLFTWFNQRGWSKGEKKRAEKDCYQRKALSGKEEG
jgi:electron transfer flavoprotein-quinone oxidoreductase